MGKNYFLSFIIVLSVTFTKVETTFAQTQCIDSLLGILSIDTKEDTNKVLVLIHLSRKYIDISSYGDAKQAANTALAISRKINFQKGIAKAYNNIGIIYWDQGDYPQALTSFFASLKIKEKLNDKESIADSYNNIGLIYKHQGDYDEALKNYNASLKIAQEINDKQSIAISYNNIGLIFDEEGNAGEAMKNYLLSLSIKEGIGDQLGIANSYNNIGTVYESKNDFVNAIRNYFNALEIQQKIGDKQGIADSYTNIGNIYLYKGDYSEALKNNFHALAIKKEIGDKEGIANSYNSLGNIYYAQKDYSQALTNHLASLKIAEDIGDKDAIVYAYTSLGTVLTALNKLPEAKEYYDKALALSKEIGNKTVIRDSYLGLTELDSLQSNWQGAYFHNKLYISYRDSIDNEEMNKKIIQTTLSHEFEKKELALKAEQVQKDVLAKAKRKRARIILILISLAFIMVIIFTVIIFRALRVTKKQQKDIIDSINYAKIIQDAVLKQNDAESKHLPDYFILFKPKDIVSGDFHWSLEKNGYWYLAAVDCTGHGVPGAFMSMLGIAFLNEINASVRLLSPAEILDSLRDKVIKELGHNGGQGQAKDGMDISLIRLNLQTNELQWAGANNPLCIVRKCKDKNPHLTDGLEAETTLTIGDSTIEFIKIKANKQPIGYYLVMKPFTNHTMILEKDTTLYLFTDGFADQFNGETGKKFMSVKLKDLFLSMYGKPLEDQKEIMDSTFKDWKGNSDQIDDVCVIGVRL